MGYPEASLDQNVQIASIHAETANGRGAACRRRTCQGPGSGRVDVTSEISDHEGIALQPIDVRILHAHHVDTERVRAAVMFLESRRARVRSAPARCATCATLSFVAPKA